MQKITYPVLSIIETRFDTSKYELDHGIKEKIKNVIGLMKDELGGKIIK